MGEDYISYQLILKCADGLTESQGYDAKEEAEQAGKDQIDDFVLAYEVTPYVSMAGFARSQSN